MCFNITAKVQGLPPPVFLREIPILSKLLLEQEFLLHTVAGV